MDIKVLISEEELQKRIKELAIQIEKDYQDKDINLVCNQAVFPGDKVEVEKIDETFIINHLLNRTSILSRTKKDSTRLNDVGSTKNIDSNVDLNSS